MKTNYLFPHKLRLVSGILFVVALAALIIYTSSGSLENTPFNVPVFAIVGDNDFLGPTDYFFVTENPIVDELLMVLVIASGIIFAFSKERHEDEMVASIRLNSLAWATIANYGILLFCYLFIFGFPFLNVLMGAMFSQLVIFIILFRYKMYRFYNSRQDEE
ncbi:hypothetical protein [uncultured Flavobacterium sp.]|uniref:hypothetical protein n=1 Tax=uncultured Flavobacterium sp. TaxID=165435 RepID=UPI0025E9A673|nr:hypothetical protein [uncultured Flavobacterium sp.]